MATVGDFVDYVSWVYRGVENEQIPHYIEPEFTERCKWVWQVIVEEQRLDLLNQILFHVRFFLFGFIPSIFPVPRNTVLGPTATRAYWSLRRWVLWRRNQEYHVPFNGD